jgi:hypothetical protein
MNRYEILINKNSEPVIKNCKPGKKLIEQSRLMILKCTPDSPYTPERHVKGARWEHSDADEVPGSQKNGWPSGDIVTMKCNTCGITWEEELPQ